MKDKISTRGRGHCKFLLIGFEKFIANSIGIKRSSTLRVVSSVINRLTGKHSD